MKWTYSVKNKMMASGALLLLCILVLLSNYLDRVHSRKVKAAISTLYEDRIIVQEYILDMTSSIYEIRHAVVQPSEDSIKAKTRIVTEISKVLNISDAYLETQFTTLEEKRYAEFMVLLKEFEQFGYKSTQEKIDWADNSIAVLHDLSSIQLAEGKLITGQAEGLYNSGKMLSQFAFGVTIIILLVLQALVFAFNTINVVEKPSGHNLN